MTKVAILIDGGYFLKRLSTVRHDVNAADAEATAKAVNQLVRGHLNQLNEVHHAPSPLKLLYRAFYYDARPYERKATRPIPALRQKGVDMRIGLDIASITLKQQANVIVLVSGDADFVPAAKFARREGVQFILDPLWQNISPDLFEHIDGLRSGFYKPRAR